MAKANVHEQAVKDVLVEAVTASPRRSPATMLWAGTFVTVAAAIAVALAATPYMAAATFSYGVLTLGLLLRRTPRFHVRLMTSGIVMDLAIVLSLEAYRHAIKTAAAMTMTPLQQGHVAASSIAALLYVPTLTLGWLFRTKRLAGDGRRWHARFGIAAYAFRSVGFLLMFSLLARHAS